MIKNNLYNYFILALMCVSLCAGGEVAPTVQRQGELSKSVSDEMSLKKEKRKRANAFFKANTPTFALEFLRYERKLADGKFRNSPINERQKWAYILEDVDKRINMVAKNKKIVARLSDPVRKAENMFLSTNDTGSGLEELQELRQEQIRLIEFIRSASDEANSKKSKEELKRLNRKMDRHLLQRMLSEEMVKPAKEVDLTQIEVSKLERQKNILLFEIQREASKSEGLLAEYLKQKEGISERIKGRTSLPK